MNLKPTHKAVQDYYATLNRYARLGIANEGAVRSACQALLESCARQERWTFVPEHSMTSLKNTRIAVDGALFDEFELPRGYWEAKDMRDDLPAEIQRKFDRGYPRNNILFQTPERAILWQHDQEVLDADLTDPTQLVEAVQAFFAYRPEHFVEWEKAVAEFKDRVPALGKRLAALIHEERGANSDFRTAFRDFHEKCCQSINPNLSEAAVEEMLIQHLLTERIFRTVFDNPDFTRRNVIANEIENVIDALTSQSFSRASFLQRLDRFYIAIERNAATITDFSRKQAFLNTVYEQFFQGFSVKAADTHGIVYTPQPIVDFMVKSVDHILRTEFNRSLSDAGVHIIDPFVGTGNFVVRIMREISGFALADKYGSELHCNEVMLLPYYIASMNIEHQFYEMTGRYQPFDGICLVDTFELVEQDSPYLPYFTQENARRVQEQKDTPMFVIIGNPPYNVGQVNENDNNKNRVYEKIDERVRLTYANDSSATLKSQLYDPYVKAIRWASDRIGDEGIVAFVTNNGFLDGVAFDGMRKHLAENFDAIYILDLGGNARRGLKVSDANVFGIRVGVSVNFFVKTNRDQPNRARIHYCRLDELWNKRQKFDFMEARQHIGAISWQSITPDQRFTWLTEGLQPDFARFVPLGSKAAKAAKGDAGETIFKTYSGGVKTNRDAWAYNFSRNALTENMRRMIDTYNTYVLRWQHRENREVEVDDFVVHDDTKIGWSGDLKLDLQRGVSAEYSESKIRNSLYRPYTKSNLFFDRVMNNRVYLFPSIFPTPDTETENQVIIVSDHGFRAGFNTLMSNLIPDIHTLAASDAFQCFPFYTYDEDGGNRRENITDWALTQFRTHYRDDTIDKRGIFHYVYALLHHVDYRERYGANLKRDLPRLPYAPDFRGFAEAGARLAEIHVGYEDAEEYRGENPGLQLIETPGLPLDWRVEKMKLSKDRTLLKYNNYLTLAGIPSKAFDYRLGNRSALEWVIDQYRVKIDKRSGIVNDPNRADDPQYIIRLIRKVISVSLETVSIVEALPELRV